jgi:hypothetical protein
MHDRKENIFLHFFLSSFIFCLQKNLYIWLQLRIRNKECNL